MLTYIQSYIYGICRYIWPAPRGSDARARARAPRALAAAADWGPRRRGLATMSKEERVECS